MSEQLALIFFYMTMLSGFSFYTTKYMNVFNGSSISMQILLMLSSFTSYIAGIGLTGYFMYQFNWYMPILIYIGSIVLAGVVFIIIERVVGFFTLAVASTLLWPVFAYLIYSEISAIG